MANRTARRPAGLEKWAASHGRALTALFFALLVLVGAAAVRHTGPGLDDAIERKTLGINIKAYAGRFGLADADFFSGLPEEPLAQWKDRDYGQARFYPVWPLMNALERAGHQGLASYTLFFYNHLLFLVGLFALYALVFRLTGSRAAGQLGVLLLWLNPRFFAASFYNTKDMPFLALSLVTFWLGLRFLEGEDWSSCVWFGFAGALAMNGRLPGIAAFGLVGLAYLALLTLQKRWSLRAFWRGVAAVASLAGFWYLITPAAWGDPLGFFGLQLGQTVNFDSARWGGWVLYRGALYNAVENPIPWHYIPWLICITTPLLVLCLAVAWPVLLALKNGHSRAAWQSTETVFSAAVGLFSFLPVAYAMLRRPNLYNGWRHMYFVYGGIVLYAGLAAWRLWQLARKAALLGRRRLLSGLLAAVLAVHLGYYGGLVACCGANGCGYFNLLAGPHPEMRYEADYWCIGLRSLMEEMQQLDPVLSVVPINEGTGISASWYTLARMLPPMAEGSEEVTWDRRGRARYVVENVSGSVYAALRRSPDGTSPDLATWNALMNEQTPVYELRCGDTVLWRVYQNPQYNGPAPKTRAAPLG